MWNLFKRKTPIPMKTTPNPVFDAFAKGICPDCGGEGFLEGPSGGLCTNFKCSGCGSEFNIGTYCGQLIHAERI